MQDDHAFKVRGILSWHLSKGFWSNFTMMAAFRSKYRGTPLDHDRNVDMRCIIDGQTP